MTESVTGRRREEDEHRQGKALKRVVGNCSDAREPSSRKE